MYFLLNRCAILFLFLNNNNNNKRICMAPVCRLTTWFKWWRRWWSSKLRSARLTKASAAAAAGAALDAGERSLWLNQSAIRSSQSVVVHWLLLVTSLTGGDWDDDTILYSISVDVCPLIRVASSDCRTEWRTGWISQPLQHHASTSKWPYTEQNSVPCPCCCQHSVLSTTDIRPRWWRDHSYSNSRGDHLQQTFPYTSSRLVFILAKEVTWVITGGVHQSVC